MILEVIANIDDLVRIARLEAAGKLWKGATQYAWDHAIAYQVRLTELKLRERPANV